MRVHIADIDEGNLREARAAFFQEQGCLNKIWSLRQIFERCVRKGQVFGCLFVNFAGDFNLVYKGSPWAAMPKSKVNMKAQKESLYSKSKSATAWKVSKYGVFSGPYFSAFELNMERYISIRIQSECREIRTKKSSLFGYFSRSASVISKLFNFEHVPICWVRPSSPIFLVRRRITINEAVAQRCS